MSDSEKDVHVEQQSAPEEQIEKKKEAAEGEEEEEAVETIPLSTGDDGGAEGEGSKPRKKKKSKKSSSSGEAGDVGEIGDEVTRERRKSSSKRNSSKRSSRRKSKENIDHEDDPSSYGEVASPSSASMSFDELIETPPSSSYQLNYQLEEEPVEIRPKTEETDDKKKKKESKKDTVSLLTLYRYATIGEKVMLFVGAITAVLAGVAQPAFAIIFGSAVDTVTDFSNIGDTLNGMILYFVYLALGTFVATWFEYNAFTYVSQVVCNRTRERLFQAMMRKDIGWFDSQSSGDLVSRIASDVDMIQDGIGEKVGRMIEGVAACVAGFVIGFGYNWELSLVILAVVPLLMATGAFFGRAVAWAVTRMQTVYAKSSSIANEAFSNIRTVIAYGGEETEIERYETALQEAGKKSSVKSHATGFGLGAMLMVVNLTYALGFYYGSLLVERGEISPGHLLIVVFALVTGTQALGNAADPIASISSAKGAGYYVYKTIDEPLIIDPLMEKGRKERLTGNIEFKNVTFRYPSRPDIQILKGLSFKITPGQTVAFVGPSGCGKSTTIGLIERFYNAESGSILLDGVDIKEYNLKNLRRSMALVSQEPILFARTIYENIVMGAHESVTKEQVEAAAKKANAHDFIMRLPEGYNSVLGTRGTKLSGGEKQRVAIARALISNPSILMLDEATSALDSQSEKIVQEALDNAREGRTTLVIAHRLSTIQNADRICVIYEGKLVESGTHKELMEIQDGLYRRMVLQQQVDEGKEKKLAGGKTRKESEGLSEDESASSPLPLEKLEVTDSELNILRKKNPSSRNWLRRLFKYAAIDFWPLILSTFFSLMNGATFSIYSYLYARVLFGLFGFMPGPFQNIEAARNEVNTFCWAFVIYSVGLGVIAYGRVSAMYLSAERLANRLRQMVFRALVRQEMGYFDLPENTVGTLITKLALEGANLEKAAGFSLSSVIMVAGTFVATAITGFYMCPKLCAVVLAALPVVLGGGFFRMRIMSTAHIKIKKVYEHAGHLSSEAVSNPRTVASLTCEEVFFADYKKQLEYPLQIARKDAALAGLAFGTANMSMFLIWGLAFWYGGQLMSSAECDPIGFFTTSMNIIFGGMIMAMVLTGFPDFRRAELSAISVFSVIDRKSAIPTLPAEGDKLDSVKGVIEISNVNFSYPTRPDLPILKGLDLKIESGQTVAVVGGSGSGKSTTVQLIQRFYDPVDGVVKLDGVDLRDLDVNWLRSQIGVVSQEPILFNMSLVDNIRYGKKDATMEEVIEACKVSNIHEFITRLPEQYETKAGEMGVQLSGGQKQRIAIARAMIRNPKILLLDEATSALDTRSEAIVQTALEKASKGRTTVVVAHRLKTIANADKIAFLENGVIAEIGTHKQLMAKKGKYYNMVKTQAQFR